MHMCTLKSFKVSAAIFDLYSLLQLAYYGHALLDQSVEYVKKLVNHIVCTHVLLIMEDVLRGSNVQK